MNGEILMLLCSDSCAGPGVETEHSIESEDGIMVCLECGAETEITNELTTVIK
jgi:hypothetical protein